MPVVDDEDRYSSKKRANLTFNELIRGKSSAEESSTLVTLKAEYNPEDDEDMEDQGYEDAYEAEDFREEGMDHYNELFDNDGFSL
jgi:hypothetical protein